MSILSLISSFYKNIAKPILFKIDPEIVHEKMSSLAESLGTKKFTKKIIAKILVVKDARLNQKIAGINFVNPLGLAAGFDYEAKFTQITPSVGFGFQSIGTISNMPYAGNPRPLLGRLPKSKSLMVNKGFKNLGAIVTAKKLAKLKFALPIGVSIGRTNDANLNQKQSIEDIISAFRIFENSKSQHTYYELNISCPNLFGDVSFYPPQNLEELLTAVDRLKLKRPLFVKMPINNSDREILSMLKVIAKHSPAGVILGNLQKDRKNPLLVKSEVRKFTVGNFSGKPTFDRSNQLISLVYKHYKKRFIIIGCGGVFSAEDAYEKIKRGASLVQLITGMIFQGPQLISEINRDLLLFLQRDGYKNIKDAVGTKHV